MAESAVTRTESARARTTLVPHGLIGDVRGDWADVGAPTGAPARFEPEMVADLPVPVRRWLTHAIAPGTPLLTSVELATRGHIQLGGWRSFVATERLSATRGFVWAAKSRMFGLPVAGFDRYSRYTGQMRWQLLGAIPVRGTAGPDVTRGAADRHAGEVLIVAQAAALSQQVKWRAVDADQAVARIKVGSGFHEVTVTVAASGALTSIALSRWGATPAGPYADRVYGAELGSEATYDGFTIPGAVIAGWEHGTDGWELGQFMRYTVDSAHYR
jgi:hypothetical protein